MKRYLVMVKGTNRCVYSYDSLTAARKRAELLICYGGFNCWILDTVEGEMI